MPSSFFPRSCLLECMNKSRELVYFDCGRFPLNQNYRNGDKWYGNFLGKFSENERFSSFPDIPQRAAQFANGNFRKCKLVFEIEKKVSRFQFLFLFYRHECFTGKNTTRNSSVYDRNIFGSPSKVFRKLQKFSENVRERLSGRRIRKFSEIVKTAVIGMPIVCLYNKKNITR